MNGKSKYDLKVIHSLDEMPSHFENEDAERDFWAEHELSDELWDSLPDGGEELDRILPLSESATRRRTTR